MAERGRGHVTTIVSLAGLVGLPYEAAYSGSKAALATIADSARAELEPRGITFTAVLPQLTPLTDLGQPAVRAYAARDGQSEDEYLARFGDPLTPAIAGAALVELLQSDAAGLDRGYLLTGSGLQKLPHPSA